MTVPIRAALEALRTAAADGRLAALADRFDLEIVTLFGSARDAAPPTNRDDPTPESREPGDIDVAVGFVPGAPRDVLGVVNALADLVPGDHLDVMDLDRAGPVAAKAALFGGRVLYARHPSVVTEREIKAFMEYEDTRWLRALQTEVLRG